VGLVSVLERGRRASRDSDETPVLDIHINLHLTCH
jgi:hypothetical protein